MQRAWIFITLSLLLWLSGNAIGQRQGSTSLTVNVAPESHVDPSRVPVRFVVTDSGEADESLHTAVITARVRSLPGRQVHLTAAISGATAPPGTQGAQFEWSGSVVRATGAARSASCGSGSFANGGAQELVGGWYESGTLTCSISFRLVNPRDLAPGVYTAVFDLALGAQ